MGCSTGCSGFSVASVRRGMACLVVVLGMLLLPRAACLAAGPEAPGTLALSAAEQHWLSQHPVVRLGIDAAYGPYSYIDEQGQFQGVVADFVRYFETALGLRFELVSHLDWPKLMEAVRERRVDAVATVVRLPEREPFLEFTDIYLPTPLVIMTRTEAPQLRSVRDLPSVHLALVEGYSSTKQVLAMHPELRPKLVATSLDGLRAVAAGVVDGYVGVLGVNTFLAGRHGITNLKVNAAFDMVDNGQRIGVRKDWPELARLLDKALAAMPEEQQAAIWGRWMPFPADEVRRLSETSMAARLFPWLLSLIALALLGYLGVLFWNRQLRRELDRRQGALAMAVDRLGGAEAIAHLGHWQYRAGDEEMRWSDETYRIFGLAPQDHPIRLAWLHARIHPLDRAGHEAYFESLLASRPGDVIPEGRFRLLRPDGAERCVRVLARVSHGEEGGAGMLFGTVQDITEQVQADRRVEALNRLYRVLGSINQAVVRLREAEPLFREACRVAVDLGGFRMAWLGMADPAGQIRPVAWAGKVDGFLDAQQGDARAATALRDAGADLLAAGHAVVFNDIAADPVPADWRDAALTCDYRAAAMLPLRVHGVLSGVFTLYSQTVGFFDHEELRLLDDLAADLGFALEFMEAEEARLALDRRILETLEGMSDGFVSLDLDWHYVYVNRKAAELLGRSPEALIGRHIWTEFPEGVGQPFHRAYEQAMQSGEMVRLEDYYAPWGRWFENRIFPGPDGISIFFTDITERRQAAAALQESEARLRLFIEHAPAALAMFDRQMRYLVVSRRWLSDYGLREEEILGKSHYAVFPDLPERWKEVHRRALAGEVVRAEEDLFERADGSSQWLRWEVRPWLVEDGSPGGIVILAEDISARKEAEARARHGEIVLDSVFQSLPDLFFLMDADGTIRDYRARRQNDLYVPPETFLGRRMQDVLPPVPARQFQTNMADVVGDGRLVTYEYDLPMADGQRHYEARLMGLPGGAQLCAVVRDITREHRDRQALAESETRYRHLFEASPAPMLVYENRSLRLLAVNEAFGAHYGYAADATLGLTLADLFPPEERQGIVELAARQGGLADVGEWHHLTHDGRRITVEARSHDLLYQGHEARLAVITDITAREALERRLREQLAELTRWQAVMLGREARLQGLKGEVNELLAAQGLAPRYPSQEQTP